jgi:hypothetical protein
MSAVGGYSERLHAPLSNAALIRKAFTIDRRTPRSRRRLMNEPSERGGAMRQRALDADACGSPVSGDRGPAVCILDR